MRRNNYRCSMINGDKCKTFTKLIITKYMMLTCETELNYEFALACRQDSNFCTHGTNRKAAKKGKVTNLSVRQK